MTSPASVWKRNLSVLGAGQFVAISAMGIVIPLIPFFLRELGMTDRAALERWSGLIFSGPFLAAALMSPIWGALGDRYGHKRMVVRAIVGLAVVNLLLVFVTSPTQFLVIRVTQGLVTGFVPAALAITSASTPREHLPQAIGKLAAFSAAGRMLGPAIGGLLAGLLAFRQLFLIAGLVMGAVAVFVSVFLKEPPHDPRATASLGAPLRAAFRNPKLTLALPGLLAATCGISMTMPIFPLFVEDLLGPGPDPLLISGIGFATVAGFTLLGSALLGRISNRVGLKALLVGSLLLVAIALGLHPFVTTVALLLALRALLGIAVAGVGPVLHSMIGRAAPDGMRGGVTGLANSATILGFFVGPIGGGLLANSVGIDGVFLVAAALAAVCAIGAAVIARRVGADRRVDTLPREVPR